MPDEFWKRKFKRQLRCVSLNKIFLPYLMAYFSSYKHNMLVSVVLLVSFPIESHSKCQLRSA